MSFTIEGKIIDKGQTQQVSDRFKKREFVIERSENSGDRTFTDYIKFQLIQDKCDLIDNYSINDSINVHFNIKGNRWEKDGKVNYFTNLDAWRIEAANGGSKDEYNQERPGYDVADAPPETDDVDDLPF